MANQKQHNYRRNIYLNISGTTIYDLDPNTIDLNYYLKDIREYSLYKTSFSKPLSIKRTATTTKFFNGLFNINETSGYFDITRKYPCQLVQDGIIVLSGWLYLEQVCQTEYQVTLYQGDVDLFTLTGDQLISQLYFSGTTGVSVDQQYSQYITKNNILKQWNKTSSNYVALTGGTDIAFPFIDYDNIIDYSTTTNGCGFNIDYQLLPAVGARQIWDKIMWDNGYTYSASSNVMKILNQIRIPCNNKDFSANILPFYYYNVYTGGTIGGYYTGRTQAYQMSNIQIYVPNTAAVASGNYSQYYNYSNQSGYVNNYNKNGQNYVQANSWTVPHNGTYFFRVSFNANMLNNLPANSGGTITFKLATQPNNVALLQQQVILYTNFQQLLLIAFMENFIP